MGSSHRPQDTGETWAHRSDHPEVRLTCQAALSGPRPTHPVAAWAHVGSKVIVWSAWLKALLFNCAYVSAERWRRSHSPHARSSRNRSPRIAVAAARVSSNFKLVAFVDLCEHVTSRNKQHSRVTVTALLCRAAFGHAVTSVDSRSSRVVEEKAETRPRGASSWLTCRMLKQPLTSCEQVCEDLSASCRHKNLVTLH